MLQITIDLTPTQMTRLMDAWEKLFGIRPTQADVKAHLVGELKRIVLWGEKKAAEEAAPPPTPFDPT